MNEFNKFDEFVSGFERILINARDRHQVPVRMEDPHPPPYPNPYPAITTTFVLTEDLKWVIYDHASECKFYFEVCNRVKLRFGWIPARVNVQRGDCNTNYYTDIYPEGARRLCYHAEDMDALEGLVERIIKRAAEVRKRHHAARKIQRAWRRCIVDPEYAMCCKRLMREFEDM